jgi:hypothetical protein
VSLEDMPITVRVLQCARCGGDHAEVEFHPLTNPPEDVSHFGMCPTSDEPILLKFTEAPESGSNADPHDVPYDVEVDMEEDEGAR